MTASADPNPPLTPSPATAPLAPSAPRLSAERSAALHRAALSALLREHFGRDGLTVDTVGAGAGAVQGDTAWLLLAGDVAADDLVDFDPEEFVEGLLAV